MEKFDIKTKYELVTKSYKEKTVIEVGKHRIGEKELTIIAGPCSVESMGQILEIAKYVKKNGAHILRGGAFKPATYPYAFQGLGKNGLELLFEARKKTNLPIITEVMDTRDVKLVYEYADILQIGTRNMQNYSLLKEVGKLDKPILLKRGMWSTFDEFLGAAEYIMKEGNDQVILCERGIITHNNHVRYTLDLSIVPSLKEKTHLPVIVDPSHGSGNRNHVIPLARAGIAAGADGLMIEVHPTPNGAISDATQTIDFNSFNKLIKEIRLIANAVGRTL